jgi:branched-subunit amino acid aminotransferase/4-amino-4-deoxychorismate lyase
MVVSKTIHLPSLKEYSKPLLSLGNGFFTTVRLTKTTNSYHFQNRELHEARLQEAAIELQFGAFNFTLIDEFITSLPLIERDMRLRVSVERFAAEDYLTFLAKAIPPITASPSISLKTYHGERPLPHIKSTSTIISSHSEHLAWADNFDSALLIDHFGHILETSWGNILWIDNADHLYFRKAGVLNGIAQQVFINKWLGAGKYATERLTDLPTLVNEAKSLFVTNSVRGVQHVSRIDNFLFFEDLGK